MKCLNKKDLLLLASNLIKIIPDPGNVKEHLLIYNKGKHKICKTIKKNYLSTKTFSNIADIKSTTTEHRKTRCYKSSKTTKQAEKVGSNRYLYSDTKKVKIF